VVGVVLVVGGAVVDGVGVVVEVVDVVVGQGAVEVVLDDGVEVDEVLAGEHGSVVDVVLDVELLEELVLVGPIKNAAGCALPPLSPSSSPPPSPPEPSGGASPPSDGSADA
jgi:hypothetical protein